MSNLRYPLRKLDSAEDYLQIDILKYDPPGIGSKNNKSLALTSSDDTYKDLLNGSDSIKKIVSSIILPIPEGIGDNMTVNWGASDMNPLQAVLLPIAQNIIQSKNPYKGAYDSVVNQGGKVINAATSATGQKTLQSALAAAAINALVGNGNINQTISRATGAIFNPNIELLFTSVNLRGPFTFSFDMIPRFQKESDEVKNIIRLFKAAMSPRREVGSNVSGVFIKSPNVFRIRYMNGGRIHPYLNRFKICALNGMNVDYTGSGTYATYSDSTPVHMRMNLVFQELTPIFHEDYYEGQGKGGTGY